MIFLFYFMEYEQKSPLAIVQADNEELARNIFIKNSDYDLLQQDFYIFNPDEEVKVMEVKQDFTWIGLSIGLSS